MPRPAHVIALTAALVGAVVIPRAARACSCLEPPPPRKALESAGAVFEGRTFAREEADGKVLYTFEVTRQWKGNVSGKVVVETAPNSAMCGRSYQEGATYLVYARDVDGHWSDNICTRTRTVDRAEEDLAELGDAVSPAQPTEPPPAAEPPRIEPTAPPVENDPPAAEPTARGCRVGTPSSGATHAIIGLILMAGGLGLRRSMTKGIDP